MKISSLGANSMALVVNIFAKNSFRLFLGFVFLGTVIMLPTRVPAWFDGLPWVGDANIWVVLIIIPFLLFIGKKFLSFQYSIFFLAGLIILKAILFFGAPTGGWLVKVYPKMEQKQLYYGSGYCIFFPAICKVKEPRNTRSKFNLLTSEGWVKTFSTVWNQKASGILQQPWKEKLDFPLDWALPLSAQTYKGLNPVIEIEGTLLVPEGKQFVLIAEGVEEGNLIAKNEEGKIFTLSPLKSFAEAKQVSLLPEGQWKVSGKLKYKGPKWSLIPTWVESNQVVISNLERGNLWQDESVLYLDSKNLAFYISLSWVSDALICLFFLVWAIWTARFLIDEQVLTLPLASFSFLIFCVPILFGPMFNFALKMVNQEDLTKLSHLGISTTFAGLGFLFWTYCKNDYRNFHPSRIVQSIFLFFGLPVLCFFLYKWTPQIGQWKVFIPGDDMGGYQFISRRILVGGEWLSGGESALMGKELYPYIRAIAGGLFGQSVVSWSMFDVWSVLGAATLLGALALKFRMPPLTAFLTSMAYLCMTFIGSYRYLIGKGMSEYTAMIFIILAGWFLLQAREGGRINIFLATLCGILGYWGRQDHLGVIAALAVLTLEPIEGPTGAWKGYWDRFKINWQRMVYYWSGGIVIGVGLICWRNWLLGSDFYFVGTGHPHVGNAMVLPFSNFYTIITGNTWPIFPSISAFFLASGLLVAILALVWRPKPLLNFPLSLSIALLGLFAPYVLVSITGYVPRWSIHFLPLALLSFIIFLNNVLKDNRIILKFNDKK
jgi:hypothetical protein